MTHSVAPGSSYKTVVAGWVGAGGGWKRVLGRWVGVGGAWKQFFVAGLVRLVPATIRGYADSPALPQARIDFTANGDVTATYTDHTFTNNADLGNWYDPLTTGAGSSFQIRANKVAGEAAISGSSLGTWLTLSSTRSWQIGGSGLLNAGYSASLKVDIREVGGTEVIASAIYLLSTVTFNGTYPSGLEGREGGVNIPVKPRWDV